MKFSQSCKGNRFSEVGVRGGTATQRMDSAAAQMFKKAVMSLLHVSDGEKDEQIRERQKIERYLSRTFLAA